MTALHRTLTTSVVGCAALGLLAAPASAWGTHSSSPQRASYGGVFSDQLHDTALSTAAYQTWLGAKLDHLATRLAADTAQWGAVAPTTVLTGHKRKAAVRDLAAARWALKALAAVDATRATDAQKAQAATLTTGLKALSARLTDLLDNARPATVSSTSRLDSIEARTAGDRAQWAGVTALTTAAQKAAAWDDLLTAKRNLWFLSTVTQTAEVDALQADVLALKAQLKALLGATRTGDDRRVCDRDGSRFAERSGDRYGSRDGDRSWSRRG